MFKYQHPEWGTFIESGEYRHPVEGEFYKRIDSDKVNMALRDHDSANRTVAILVSVESDKYTVSTTYMQWVARHLSSMDADYKDNQTVELVNVTEEDLVYMRNNNANVIARKAVKYGD